MTVHFVTREIGSLARPSWRVKAFAGRPLEPDDLLDAERWGQRLEIPEHERLLEVLRAEDFSLQQLDELDDFACRYALRLLEQVGLEVVYDGEQRRSEMYDHVVTHTDGFDERGVVRAFDNKYYTKAAVTGRPSLPAAYDVDEYRFVRASTDRDVKVPLTGAYTIVDWSYDEHYRRPGALGSGRQALREARQEFVTDVAERVIQPNARALVDQGAGWVQIDEPAAASHGDEAGLVVHGFNAATRGLTARKSLHICFSDYTTLWPAVLDLDDCFELQLEFANRDSRELGTQDRDRPGYERTLKLFREPGSPNVGLGVLDIHSDFIDPPELVRDRILYAVRVLEDPTRVQVNPDCGLRTRTWEVVYEKLARMVEGTRQAEETLNGS